MCNFDMDFIIQVIKIYNIKKLIFEGNDYETER